MAATLAYSVAAAADASSLSVSHLKRAIGKGELRVRKSQRADNGEPVGKLVILAADLQAYLDSLPEA